MKLDNSFSIDQVFVMGNYFLLLMMSLRPLPCIFPPFGSKYHSQYGSTVFIHYFCHLFIMISNPVILLCASRYFLEGFMRHLGLIYFIITNHLLFLVQNAISVTYVLIESQLFPESCLFFHSVIAEHYAS